MKPRAARSPTFRQLAKLAGTSVATISLALRNHPSLPPATRRRIQRLAERKGYRYDPLVARLMAQLRTTRANRSTETLAVLTTWRSRDDERTNLAVNLHFVNYLAGVYDRANKLGYEIDVFWTKEPGLTGNRLGKILQARGIRGVIIPPMGRSYGHISLNWEYFASVAMSHTVVRPNTHRVCHSCYNGMQLTLRRLKQRGYRRPGFITKAEHNQTVDLKWLASYLAHNQFNLPPESKIPPLLTLGPNSRELRDWIEKYRPDVVVSNMLETYLLLRELGYSVPDEIGFASLDRCAERDAIPLDLSGVDQQDYQQGVAVVNLLVEQIQNNILGLPATPVTLHIDGIWHDGRTVRPHQGSVP